MNKCVKCVFYNLRPSSLQYNLSYCLKFNTFSEIARLDEKKCGPKYVHFVKIKPYDKFSVNF
jgi:hypothetical protein